MSSYGHAANQEGMKIDGQEPLNVFFLDNGSKMVLCNRDSTAGEVSAELAQKIGFAPDEAEQIGKYFCFYESEDGQMATRAIGEKENIVEVQAGCAKIIYMMKLFMDKAMALTDPVAVRLMFVQAHHNIVTGHYYCPRDTLMQLAALLMYDKFGKHDPEKHKPGFIPPGRLFEFIPATIMNEQKPQVWEEEIYAAHAALEPPEGSSRAAYLDVCKGLDCYGCEFFEAKQYCILNLPSTLLIGINAKGIWLMKVETREKLELFKLSEIYRWGFKPGMNFYFEAKGEVANERGPVYEFNTNKGNCISELLTDYAHALLEELGIMRKAQPPPPQSAPPGANAPPGQSLTEDEAAIKLQANFRGYKMRNELERDYAAIQIQCLWRGYQERVRFDEMIEAMEKALDVEEEA